MTFPKINISAPIQALRQLTKRQWILIGSGLGVFLIAIYVVAFFDKSVAFSYAGQTCIKRTTLLPGLFRGTNSEGYVVELTDTKKLGNTPLISGAICVNATKSPRKGAETVSVSLFGTPLMRQKVVVKVDDLPRVDTTKLNSPVATHIPLLLPLSTTDKVHRYFLQSGNEKATCNSIERAIQCDIAALDLKQGSEYMLTVGRQFPGDQEVRLVEKAIKTLSPVSVTGGTIKQGETVYSVPASLELTFDKKITKQGEVILEKIEGDKRLPVAQTATTKEAGLTVTFKEPLPRSATYELRLTNFVAVDGSTLYENAYVHSFRTSGGPTVTGVNVGRSGVSQNATVVVSFDQPLSSTQDISSIVRFAGGNATISRQGSQLVFKLNGLPLCTDFSIAITKDLQSNYGIAGNSAWNFGSRTICHSISTIGYSVQGRAINAYTFGSGTTAILYIGATHGNEISSMYLMERWIDELEANARSIPGDKRIIVIPRINPDGVAAGTRRNAHGVDLNRNFPTADWKSDVTMPGGELVVGGGGSAPLSEPESRAIAAFTQQLQPRIVLTYHSVAGLVTPNEAGVSPSLASIYSSLSGYYVSPKGEADSTFAYDTNGAYEDWLYEGPGIAAILVELSSNTYSQFERNQQALWAMMIN